MNPRPLNSSALSKPETWPAATRVETDECPCCGSKDGYRVTRSQGVAYPYCADCGADLK